MSAAAPGVLRAVVPEALGEVTARARSLDQLHSLILRQGDETLIAEAIRGRPLDRPANIKSVSKTILALLVGIAIDKGILPGTDAPALPILGRRVPGREGITVGHLMSMTAGLQSTSGGNYGAWVSSRDWVDYALRRDVTGRPGSRFTYSTGSTHVLGATLAEASGESLLTLARRWLGAPLGIDIPPWTRDPQGYYFGGNEMALTPEALARIGQMVLSGGRYGGQQVVPRSWIRTSFTPRARSPWSGDGYGYGWFVSRVDGEMAAYGRGYGGQVLMVVPARQLVIVVTSDPMRPARSRGYFGDLKDLAEMAAAAARA